MQDARVGARGHDRWVGVAGRALRAEDELDGRLHLVLVHAGPGEPHRFDVGVAADLTRPPLARELGLRVTQAKIVQERARVLDALGRREAAGAGGAEVGHQPDHAGVERGEPKTVVHRRPLDRVLAQLGVELVHGYAASAP